MNIRKPLAVAAAAAAVVLGAVACHGPNAQQKEQQQQTADTTTLDNNQPIPHFDWSQYRQTLIDTETIAANGTPTTTFFFNQGVRDPVFTCPSLGMPVPVTAQLSNPEQIAPITSRWGGGATVLPEEDPFGAYSPPDSTGTWVICVDSAGRPYLQDWEGNVMSQSVNATWDYKTHTVKVTGAPTFVPKTKPRS